MGLPGLICLAGLTVFSIQVQFNGAADLGPRIIRVPNRGLPMDIRDGLVNSLNHMDDVYLHPSQRPLTSFAYTPERQASIDKLVRRYGLTLGSNGLVETAMNRKSWHDATDFFKDYRRVKHINQFLFNLQANNPSKMKIEILRNRTHEGRPIFLVTISNHVHRPKPSIIFNECGTHAREWISPATCLWLIHEAVAESTFNDYLDDVELQFIPLHNPDGYEYSHTHNRKWRKNRRRAPSGFGEECAGVDLNRNWDVGGGLGRMFHGPCISTYGGPGPLSEPETYAEADHLQSLAPGRLKMFLAFHSFGQLIVSPYGYTKMRAAFHDETENFGREVSEAIESVSGRKYSVGSTVELLYFALGVSVDWVRDNLDIKYTYTIELPPSIEKPGFLLPPREIVLVGEEITEGYKHFLDKVANSSPKQLSTRGVELEKMNDVQQAQEMFRIGTSIAMDDVARYLQRNMGQNLDDVYQAFKSMDPNEETKTMTFRNLDK